MPGCASFSLENRFGDESLIGQTITQAVERLDLNLGEYYVVQEPPGVPRGIYGKDKDGYEVQLFIKRGEVPFSENINWEFSSFLDKRIIGVIRQNKEERYVFGEIPVDFRRYY